jgi:hypothetical protein
VPAHRHDDARKVTFDILVFHIEYVQISERLEQCCAGLPHAADAVPNLRRIKWHRPERLIVGPYTPESAAAFA